MNGILRFQYERIDMKCMETYFSASVMEKIDDILDRVEQLGSKVAVLNYGTAA